METFKFIGAFCVFTQKVQNYRSTPVDSTGDRKKGKSPERAKDQSFRMVRLNRVLLKDAGNVIDKTLSEILVCPLSKQPLRFDFSPSKCT